MYKQDNHPPSLFRAEGSLPHDNHPPSLFVMEGFTPHDNLPPSLNFLYLSFRATFITIMYLLLVGENECSQDRWDMTGE